MSNTRDTYVIDASMGWPPCCCPIDGDIRSGNFSVVIGMNYIGVPPGPIVAIVHEDGQEAVDAFYSAHATEIDEIVAESKRPR